MGFNTALMICNDGLNQLDKDPLAGRKIVDGVLRASACTDWGDSVSIGNHCNPVAVLQSQHADYAQLVLVGGNTIRRITTLGGSRARFEWDAEGVFQMLAKQLGYNVRKTAWRARKDALPTTSAQGGI